MIAPLPVRNCIACGQQDTDPRHVITLPDHTEINYHMDCHARANPPCPTCTDQIAGAKGKTGGALREHIVTSAVTAEGN